MRTSTNTALKFSNPLWADTSISKFRLVRTIGTPVWKKKSKFLGVEIGWNPVYRLESTRSTVRPIASSACHLRKGKESWLNDGRDQAIGRSHAYRLVRAIVAHILCPLIWIHPSSLPSHILYTLLRPCYPLGYICPFAAGFMRTTTASFPHLSYSTDPL